MKTSLSVLNSDGVNKYGYRFSVSALESAMWTKAVVGVPCHLGHDMHKPIGWMIPYGLYFQPGLVRSVGEMLFPETEEEQKRIFRAKKNYMLSQTAKEIEQYSSLFLPFVKEFLSSDFKYLDAGAFSVVDNNVVERIFPKLVQHTDKDNLIPLSELLEEFTYKAQGVFVHKTLPICVYAHPYFRRSLSRYNNFHFIFLDELMSHSSNPDVVVKIALDWDMVGYSPSYFDALELEYWFGPKFNDDISSIAPGLTKHQSNEMERLYYGISSTEFFWKINDNLHEFELEELKEEQAPSLNDTYGCRYIHSIYNDDAKTFIHFDGAIRSYKTELYFERIDKKMTEFGRRSLYTKLFRVDGKLSVNDWKSLSTNYLQGNPLIYEYFGLEKPTTSYILNHAPKSVKEELVPYSINKGDGVRLMVSYHEKNEKYSNSHTVSICDVLSIDGVDKPFLEYDVIEVKKALNRVGKNLIIPNDTLLGYAEDMYWNIPCIFHGSENPQGDTNCTIIALKSLIDALEGDSINKVISFTISWNMEDKEVRLAVLGHVQDLSLWLAKTNQIPALHEEFVVWLESQNKYLNSTKVKNPELPLLGELSQFDGVLYMKRRIVTEEYNLKFEEDPKGLAYVMEVPDNKPEIALAINNGEIKPVISCIVNEIDCSKSGSDYWQSPYSKILDKDVYCIVKKCKIMHAYWTDKPA